MSRTVRFLAVVGLIAELGCSDKTGPAPAISVSLSIEPVLAGPGDTIRIAVTAVPIGGTVVEMIRLSASGLVTSSDSVRISGRGTQSYARTHVLPFQPPSGSVSLVATAEGGGVAGSARGTVQVADTSPPEVSSASATPGVVQPGEVMTVRYSVADNAGLAWTAVRISGALTATDSVDHGFARSLSRSVQFQVPGTAPLGGTVDVRVVASDVAHHLDSASAGSVHVTDLAAPVVVGFASGPDVTLTLVAGDTLRLSVRGTDNYGVAWLGFRLGPPASTQDSVAATGTTASALFKRVVQSGWVGTSTVAVFARDSLGNVAEMALGAATVLDGVRQPPSLPPSATMDMDISLFLQQPLSTDTPGDHWWYSAARVGDLRSVTEPVLGVPLAILRGAPQHTPVFGQAVWRWRFTVDVGGAPYATDLTGRVEGEESVWEARVTAPNHGVYNGLWFAGRARVDGSQGAWTIYHVQSQPDKELATVDWSHPELDRWIVKLDEPGLLRFGETNQAEYQVAGNGRTLRYVKALSSGTAELDAGWDVVRRDGFLITPVYNDGVKVCWGGHLEDIACPP